MSNPVYLPIRDRLVLRHAAQLLEREAKILHHSNNVDGVLIDRTVKDEYRDYTDTAQNLRQIARTRK